MRVVLPPDDGWPWRLLGWVNRADGQSIEAIAWASHDLGTWTTTPLPGRGSIIQSATHEPGRDIAVGRANQASMTWTSEDGTHWQVGDENSPPIETIATGPVRVLGLIGIWDDAGGTVTGFEVWRLVEER